MALVPFRGHRLHLDRRLLTFPPSAPSIIGACVLLSPTYEHHLRTCIVRFPSPLSTSLGDHSHPASSIVVARGSRACPHTRSPALRGGRSPAAPHGDARAPHRVLHILKQDRVKARPYPPPPRPRSPLRVLMSQTLSLLRSAPHLPWARIQVQMRAQAWPQRRADCRVLTSPRTSCTALIW
ncbi:hypothetical protein B0H13DRAFT_571246 [Mycena leptocephala]|nr:hypothetical protein B0H13DRAFT_571246 [Mycena leptocephala]